MREYKLSSNFMWAIPKVVDLLTEESMCVHRLGFMFFS